MSTVIGDERVVLGLKNRGPLYERRILLAITRLTINLQRDVQANKLSGQVLNVRSGTLRRSIDFKVSSQPGGVQGRVSTNVLYGILHELGLRAQGEASRELFQQPISVARPTGSDPLSSLPKRSFLRRALRDLIQSGRIQRDLDEAVSL